MWNCCYTILIALQHLPDRSDLCYTVSMVTNQHMWRSWAERLRRWGLSDWAASFLEASGPMTWFGAQAVYIGQPVLRMVFSDANLIALAGLLENPEQVQAFSKFLRETENQWP